MSFKEKMEKLHSVLYSVDEGEDETYKATVRWIMIKTREITILTKNKNQKLEAWKRRKKLDTEKLDTELRESPLKQTFEKLSS